MKILDVTVRNFGSFFGQQPPFRIDGRGLVLILGQNLDEPRAGSNGSGKSTLLDAVDWAFFGDVPRGDSADSVVNEKARKDCEVSVRLERDDGSELLVIRSRGVKGVKNGVRFSTDQDGLDTKKTQERLERELGLNREVFHAAVMFAQFDDWRFADATDAERKALLTKIVPELTIIDGWLERTKELLNVKEAEHAHAARHLELAEARKESHLKNDPRPMSAHWEAQKADRIAAAQANVQTAQADYQRAHQHAQAQGGHMQVPEPPQPPPELTQAEHEVQTAQGNVRGALSARAAAEATARNLEQTLAKLQTAETCPTCGQPLPKHADPGAVQAELQEAQAAFQNASSAEFQARQHEQAAMAHRVQLLETFQKSTTEHDQAVRYIHEVNQRVDSARRDAELAQGRVTAAMQAAEQTAAEANPYAAHIQKWQYDLEQLDAELEGHELRLVEVNEDVIHLEFWKDAFGPRGIKSHVLDSKLQAMSDEANRWLQILFGGTVWVRFETQTKVGKGKNEKLVDAFNVRVFRHNPDGTQTERSYRSWSGGEKHRISTGIDFGLARLVASRAELTWDVLFLDEIFGKHLDQSGKEAVAEMLRALMQEKSSIFVVDHDPRFQSMFEETVVVQKSNGDSTILEAST